MHRTLVFLVVKWENVKGCWGPHPERDKQKHELERLWGHSPWKDPCGCALGRAGERL